MTKRPKRNDLAKLICFPKMGVVLRMRKYSSIGLCLENEEKGKTHRWGWWQVMHGVEKGDTNNKGKIYLIEAGYGSCLETKYPSITFCLMCAKYANTH